MVKFYLILFNYRDLHLIDARTGEFIRLGCRYYAGDAPPPNETMRPVAGRFERPPLAPRPPVTG
jgi:hypothetical protein